jgi:hypothetical protein
MPVEKVNMGGGKRMYRRIMLSVEFSPEDWRLFLLYCGELHGDTLDGVNDGSVWSEAVSNAAAAGLRIVLAEALRSGRP